MTGGIFISYRRDDARHAAGRLADDLAEHFDPACIFRDIEGIDPGVDFVDALEQALGACAVMLVLIGHRWLDITDAAGRQRLQLADDWIRQEIASALARGIRVVPVLLEGARLPDAQQLPGDLRPLCRRQTAELSDTRWSGDLRRLVETLERVPGVVRRSTAGARQSPPRARRWGRRTLWLGAGAGALGLAALTGVMSPPALNVGGVWRSHSGENYHFRQDGRTVRLTAEKDGRNLGRGRGEIDGDMLRLDVSLQVPGTPFARLNCDMQAAPDRRSFVGSCMGPNGQFPARIFR